MKERPILFNTEMVNAILEGRKTQTRRIVKPQPKVFYGLVKKLNNLYLQCARIFRDNRPGIKSPYGIIGDRLWVRETWRKITLYDGYTEPFEKHIAYKATCNGEIVNNFKWKPSIFMPRSISRITLEITDVRVERIQDISEKDASAEGCNLEWYRDNAGCEDVWPCPKCQGFQVHGALGENLGVIEVDCTDCDTSKKMFKHLWDSINYHKGFGWDVNPFVWVIEFKKI
jgi:hypothetical protein